MSFCPFSALRPALYNPREADAERLELARLSLRKLGFLLPLVATMDGEILSGHQRHAVAVDMGAARVPVLRVDVPEARRRGINILFNRATNDIAVQNTERDMGAALRGADVHSLAAKLPDITPDSPAFFPCMAAEMRDVLPLARRNVSRFVRHAANVGRMLARLGVHLPIVTTPDGTVINGVGRLEAAARKGQKEIAVVNAGRRPGGTCPCHAEPFEHGLPLHGRQCRFSALRRVPAEMVASNLSWPGVRAAGVSAQAAFRRAAGCRLHGKMEGSLRGKACWTSVQDRATKPGCSGCGYPRNGI